MQEIFSKEASDDSENEINVRLFITDRRMTITPNTAIIASEEGWPILSRDGILQLGGGRRRGETFIPDGRIIVTPKTAIAACRKHVHLGVRVRVGVRVKGRVTANCESK